MNGLIVPPIVGLYVTGCPYPVLLTPKTLCQKSKTELELFTGDICIFVLTHPSSGITFLATKSDPCVGVSPERKSLIDLRPPSSHPIMKLLPILPIAGDDWFLLLGFEIIISDPQDEPLYFLKATE